MRAARGSAANRARTAAGCSPGRLRGSGRSAAVRVPQRVHEHVGADPGQFGESAGQRRGAAESRAGRLVARPRGRRLDVRLWTQTRAARSAHGRVPSPFVSPAAARVSAPPVHGYVLRSPDGNARVWRTSHDVTSADGRSRPVRDRSQPKGEPCPATPVPGPAVTVEHRPRPGERPPQRRGLPRGCLRQRTASARRGRPDDRRAGGHGPRTGSSSATSRSCARVSRRPARAGRRSSGVAALFPTYLVVGGQELSTVQRVRRRRSAALLVPVASLAVGVVLVRGAVPKFGLAYAGVVGALAVGQLLIELYRGSSSTDPSRRRGDRRRAGADQRRRDRRRLGARRRRARR